MLTYMYVYIQTYIHNFISAYKHTCKYTRTIQSNQYVYVHVCYFENINLIFKRLLTRRGPM